MRKKNPVFFHQREKMELPDDVWNSIKDIAFSRVGSSFLSCTSCDRDVIQMFETKPFVKNLETNCRFHRGQLLTDRGHILEHSYFYVKGPRVLELDYTDNIIKCIPKVTPTYIVINHKNAVIPPICFENKHRQMIQLEPYHTFLNPENKATHFCVKCRYNKRILSKCFNCFKIHCRLPLVHAVVS